MITNWTNSADAYLIHRNYLIQQLVLESLLMHGSKHINEVVMIAAQRLSGNRAERDVTGHYIVDRLVYLQRLGLLKVESNIAEITQLGIDALKAGTYQNLVATTYYNFRSINLSWISIGISVFAFLFSLFK